MAARPVASTATYAAIDPGRFVEKGPWLLTSALPPGRSEIPMIVHVQARPVPRQRSQIPLDEDVRGAVVAGWRVERQPIVGPAQADPVAGRLDLAVPLTGPSRRLVRLDPRQERSVGRERRHRGSRLVGAGQDLPASGQRFAVQLARLTPDRPAGTRHGEQVALVARIDPGRTGDRLTGARRDRLDASAQQTDAGKRRLVHELDACLAEHLAQHGLRDARLEPPGHRLAVPGTDPLEDLGRDAADQRLLTLDVCPAQAAAEHPSNVPARLEQDDRGARPSRGDRSGDAAGGGAVDDDVGARSLCAIDGREISPCCRSSRCLR
jgi:hypothetical protein